MTAKQEVLELLQNTYCRLQCSPVAGVGVFAVRDIPSDTNPFPCMHDEEWITLSKGDMACLDPNIHELIDAFFVVEEDGSVSLPKTAFANIDISFYVNHSEQPNLRTIDGGFTFCTLRGIQCGEELLVDYGTYDHKW